MKRILTIDWDYFFTSSLQVRDEFFPDIEDGSLSAIPDNEKWKRVQFLDNVKKIQPDWNAIHQFTLALKYMEIMPKIFFYSENHGEMYNAIKIIQEECPTDNLFYIVNVDFHHDYYYTNGEKPCCDNWLRLVHEKYPDTIMNWCSRKDSVQESFGINVCKEVPIKTISLKTVCQALQKGEFDYIHLCRSDLFSPPIVDGDFTIMLNWFERKSIQTIELGEIPDRRELAMGLRAVYETLRGNR